jgi:hypothetical protein
MSVTAWILLGWARNKAKVMRRVAACLITTPNPVAKEHRKTWAQFCVSLLARRWAGFRNEAATAVFVSRRRGVFWP